MHEHTYPERTQSTPGGVSSTARLGSSWLSELRAEIVVKMEREAVMGEEEKGQGTWARDLQELG